MIKIFNRYFYLLMIFFILSTFMVYKYKIYNFITNSKECVVVLDKNINEEEKRDLINNLKNLTFQDVNIEEKNNIIYVNIKCPPEKFGFFSKWILEKYKEKNE